MAGSVSDQALADQVGEDLYFSSDYEIAAAGDYRTVTAFENLRLSILRRLSVSPGEWKTRPEYGVGIRQFVKKALTSGRKAELKNRIVENLRRDDRIEKVDEVTIEETTLGGRPVVRVTIRLTAFGRTVGLQPVTFAREV